MKKSTMYLLILLSLFVSNLSLVNAASNPYKQAGPYGTNCTWYAWNMAREKAGVNLPGWGNAKEWYNDAKNSGYSVGSAAAANSIIVWGDWTNYGHVGYVSKVEGDTLYVWDSTGPCIDEEDPVYQECMANGVSEETDKACKAAAPRVACKYSISESQYTITGFIYLNDAPKKSTNNIEAKKEEIKKSSNTNLSDIKLNVGKIDFNKNIFEYEIEVENSIEKINVEATPEDKKTTVTGTGEYKLDIGKNEIKLNVTAEDKSTKEYTIKVTRKEKIKEEKVIKNKNNINDNSHTKIYIISSIVIGFTILVIFIYKNKKNK